jgi:hypothetical protein
MNIHNYYRKINNDHKNIIELNKSRQTISQKIPNLLQQLQKVIGYFKKH